MIKDWCNFQNHVISHSAVNCWKFVNLIGSVIMFYLLINNDFRVHVHLLKQ